MDRELARTDDGFGLIEAVVSMFVLALIAMAFLPFLLQSYYNARDNSLRATANQAVSAAMERLRAESFTDCAGLGTWVTGAAQDVATEAGTILHVAGTVTDCPATGSGAATVDFLATKADGTHVTSAATRVYVTAVTP